MAKEHFRKGSRVRHRLMTGTLRVTRVKLFSDVPKRPPEYELEDEEGQAYSDVCHFELVSAEDVDAVLSQATPVQLATTPGHMYDADSGQQLGPASYELREKFDKNGGRPMEMVFGACKHKIILK